MELVFLLTGWAYAREGKKATEFAAHCKTLGVVFDFFKVRRKLAFGGQY